MTSAAQKHLDKAEEYFAKGNEFYWKAGKEIIAAQKADPTLSNTEIGKRFGKGRDWVREIVAWVTSGDRGRGPFADADNPSKRNVASDVEKDPATVVKSVDTATRVALAKEALLDPEVIEQVASDDDTIQAISDTRLDVIRGEPRGASAQHRERMRQLKQERREEEEEELKDTVLRPGLAYLAIGNGLYKAKLGIIEAMGHVRGSEITDSLNRLITSEIEELRELLVDLKLSLDGEKELTDDDISAFLKRAEDDHREMEQERR